MIDVMMSRELEDLIDVEQTSMQLSSSLVKKLTCKIVQNNGIVEGQLTKFAHVRSRNGGGYDLTIEMDTKFLSTLIAATYLKELKVFLEDEAILDKSLDMFGSHHYETFLQPKSLTVTISIRRE